MTGIPPPPAFDYFPLAGDGEIAIHSTKKLKTISLLISFAANLDEDVTQRALLPTILRRGTARQTDMQAIHRYLEGLYGTVLTSGVQKIGEWHLVRFHSDVVNDRYLPGKHSVFRKGLEFLRELLLDPLIVDDGFHDSYLEQEKNNLRRAIESLIDNKSAYAAFRMLQTMCADEPYRLHEQGLLEDIPSVQPKTLRLFHSEWLRRSPIRVYVTGDVDVNVTKSLVDEVLLSGDWQEGGRQLAPLLPAASVAEARNVVEHMDLNQAKLLLGYRHGITFGHDRYEAMLVMNGILGGFSHSKLFQNVREKANLAYSVHSSFERSKGFIVVSSGIAPQQYSKARSIMEQQVQALQDGEVSDDELQATIFTIINHNEMLEDNLPALCEADLVWRLHGKPLDLARFREAVKSVSKEDVVDMARRLELDTAYLLTAKESK